MTPEKEDKMINGAATLLAFAAIYAISVGVGYGVVKLTASKDDKSEFEDHKKDLIIGVGAALVFGGVYKSLKNK